MMPADGIDQLRDSDAIYLGAVGFPGVPDHVSLWGLLLPDPPGLRPVHQPAAGPAPRGHPGSAARPRPGRRRHPLHPREHRGRVRRPRWPVPPGPARGDRAPDVGLHAPWRGAGRALRLRPGDGARPHTLASATKSNALNYTAVFWDEVVAEVARDYPDVDGHDVPRRRAGGADGHRARHARRHRREQPLRRHPDRPRRCAPGLARAAGLGQPQPGAALPEPVRAGPRVRAATRRPGRRQPDGHGLGRGDDARPPRRAGGRRVSSWTRCAPWPRTGRAPRTWAGPPRPARSATRSRPASARPG